ncbi:MAG: CpaE family protein [Rhodoluna sp.]|jgi:MinD-like ATPase involved in chromosome partitioning or flagellar assembly
MTFTSTSARPSHLAVVAEPQQQPNQISFSANTIAIWSGSGSPGRTSLAINLAAELVLNGKRVLLIDLDSLAPSIPLALGLAETPAGLSAVLRLLDQQRLSRAELARLTVALDLGRAELLFLPGLSSPYRWEEITPERLAKFLSQISEQFDYVILDLPQACYASSRLAHPALAGVMDRDSLLRSVLMGSKTLVTVSGSDPIAAKRFLQAQELLIEIGRTEDQLVVVNRFRTGAIGSNAKNELEESYLSLAKLRIDAFIPDEPENMDRSIRNGLPLALIKRSSAARQAIKQLAEQIQLSSAKRESRG